MNKIKGIVSIVQAILKYAPVILVISEALSMVQDAIKKIDAKSPQTPADEKATANALSSILDSEQSEKKN